MSMNVRTLAHRYVDSHCNIVTLTRKLNVDWPDSNDSAEPFATLARQFGENFGGAVSVSCELETLEPQLQLLERARRHGQPLWGAFGIHPCCAQDFNESVASQLADAWRHERTVAAGEMGLDYHYDTMCDRETQRETFEAQLRLGVATGLPLVLHCRDKKDKHGGEAEEDFLRLLRVHVPRSYPLHLHCFTSSESLAKTLLDEYDRLYIGFTGVITFRGKRSDAVRHVASQVVPLDRLLVETDAPFMAPEPHRGSTCTPAHVPLVVAKLATLRDLSVDSMNDRLNENARALYQLT